VNYKYINIFTLNIIMKLSAELSNKE